MAHKVTLAKDAEVNSVSVPKGTTLSVSTSIYNRLKAEGAIKDAPKKDEE